ncbi:MAG: hypothetical protein ACRDMJ_02865 [Solirubrobacteraceae bacterium]
MLSEILIWPLRLGVRVAGAAVGETVVLTARAVGLLADRVAPRQSTAPARAAAPAAPKDAAAPAASAVPVVPPPPAPVADELPVPVPPPDAPSHVSAEPELVREEADPGAEDGAGAQLRVAEPWAGYHLMKARDVIDHLVSASPEELATIELYELSHRRRRTVVAAADSALRRRSRSRTPSPG